ncbi:MAG: corrinoid protein [Coriobacteriia bacterium]|nr:corrinoid protein [Coriobacteriia bacterium]
MLYTEEIFDLVMKGKAKLIADKVTEAVEAGEDPSRLLNEGMIAAMDELGVRFTNGEIFVPEMMVSAKAMKNGVAVLKPHLSEGATSVIGAVAIGTVAGDMHDIGKNLVAMMLESAGFEIFDLGADVSADQFVQTVKDNPQVTIICCSALLTTTMAGMKTTLDAFTEAGLRDKVKVLVGGAPITQEFSDEIGADGYGNDAAAAVRLAKSFVAA